MDNLLEIPWFLDAKNPVNIAIREKTAGQLAFETKRRNPTFQHKPAKSVQTDPTAKPDSKTNIAKKAAKQTGVEVVNIPLQPGGTADFKGSPTTSQIIRVLTMDFGHKAGSKAETKSNGFRDGMTVDEYMSNDLGISGKWHKSHIKHCVDKGFIKLEDS